MVEEDRAAIEPAVAIGILENQDPVLAPRSAQPDRVGVILDDPEPAFGVDREGDRLDHVRFGREQRDGKSLGHGHAARSLGGCDRGDSGSTGLCVCAVPGDSPGNHKTMMPIARYAVSETRRTIITVGSRSLGDFCSFENTIYVFEHQLEGRVQRSVLCKICERTAPVDGYNTRSDFAATSDRAGG